MLVFKIFHVRTVEYRKGKKWAWRRNIDFIKMTGEVKGNQINCP